MKQNQTRNTESIQDAMTMMHDIPLILFGVGGVGRALLRQIVARRAIHAQGYGLQINVLAVCDSSGAAMELGQGIDDVNLEDLLELKESGGALADHALGGQAHNDLSAVLRMAGRIGAIVVDCTAADSTIPALLLARTQGYKIVLANKKPLTTSQEVYRRLTRAGATEDEMGVLASNAARWETTVGAGLPVIATLNRIVASGDPIARIAGTFSGTLGYVMSGLQEGQRFSAIVRAAHQLGFTEPDPRDDLGGVDVARKALILARGMGWELEMTDVDVTGLYPAAMASLTVDEFLDAIETLDDAFARQVDEAQRAGQVLRYAAAVEDGRCVVGPTLVDENSPLGRLRGTDNLVEFHTGWYAPGPLVVQGRGAGTDVTAAGVLSDVIELAFTKLDV
ncbi:MAG: hypothetical protein KDD78_01325 [Caldilineaceae bacterium]|nr:hypothetical protein [Caldilineaceae bacterium]